MLFTKKVCLNELSGLVLSGVEFNKLIEGTNLKFYKLTYLDEVHNDYEFKTGINKDILEFQPEGECLPGGIYFTESEFLSNWHGDHFWKRLVTIPPEAQVKIENNKMKANVLILSEREKIEEIKEEINDEEKDMRINAKSLG